MLSSPDEMEGCASNVEWYPVKILSSWNCATEKGLQKAVIVREDSKDLEEPTSLMSVENCVLLTKHDLTDSTSCSITLQATENAVVTNVYLFSEARLIEVHGPCEEYLKTVRADFLLDDEEKCVYSADIELDHPSNFLILKLNKPVREDNLWLYGVVVGWKAEGSVVNPTFPHGLSLPYFNLEAVERRLNDLSQDLSENAQQYKKVLELCSSNSKNGRGDIQSTNPAISTLLASMFKSNFENDNPLLASPLGMLLDQKSKPSKKDNPSNLDSRLEVLLDEKFKQLENRILAQVDTKINEMENRQHTFIADGFEKIMKHLQLRSNFSGEENASQDVN